MNEDWMKIYGFVLAAVFLQEVTALSLRNEQLGMCVQVQEKDNNKIILEDCKPGSALQDWHWISETRILRNPDTRKCLTAFNVQDQGNVGLRACTAENEEVQAWSCSKKGHLILYGKGFHLSVHPKSSEIYLSKERRRSAKWKTMSQRTVCEDESHNTGPKTTTENHLWPSPVNHVLVTLKPVQTADITTAVPLLNSSVWSKEPGSSVNVYSMEYGMKWKVTMLVLSSLAIVLGTVILILNIYQNRRKKTVVVLKSCSLNDEISPPGSPIPSERAPLTKHPMKPPSSPPIQRGEILVEWKDGTITPLFDTYLSS